MKKRTKNNARVDKLKEKNNFNEIQEQRNINKAKIGVISLVLALILIYVTSLLVKFVKNPADTFVVTNGELVQEETTTGYIIREETVVKGQNYKNGMAKIKNEGEKVAKGDSIFRYYSSGEESIKQKIAELDVEIQQIMQTQETTFTSDIKLLDSEIEQKLDLIYENNSVQKIEEYKKSINEYISKKAKISGELSPSGSHLKQLLEQKEQYETSLSQGAEYVAAPASGLVSYRVDGLENVLKIDSFGNFNKEFLEKLNLKTGQTVASSEEMGKVINNYYCYIIFNSSSNEAKEAKVGDEVQIRLQNSNITKGNIENIISEDDESRTITVKITKNVEELTAYRKISVDVIWWSAEGYRIPNSALKEVDDITYVVRNRNGYYNKMPVKILEQNEEYCIVTQYKTEELKELGFTTTEIYNMRNIALYDEIVLNPTDEQLLQ